MRIGNSSFGTRNVEITHFLKHTLNLELTRNFELIQVLNSVRIGISLTMGNLNFILIMLISIRLGLPDNGETFRMGTHSLWKLRIGNSKFGTQNRELNIGNT